MEKNVVYYPLTHPQMGIWYTEKLYSGTSIATISATLRLQSNIDYVMLEKAINLFMEKNDGIRLRVDEIDHEPKQYVFPYEYRKLDFFDFTGQDIESLYKWDEECTKEPLNIFSDLFYFALIKINDHDGGFYIKVHHLISDAWSMSLVGNSIVEYYNLFMNGREIYFDNKPSYLDFIIKENEYKNSERFLIDRQYWKEKLNGFTEVSILKPRRLNNMSAKAKRKTFQLPKKLTAKLHEYCVENGLSEYSLFLAALSMYINRVTANEDLILGTTLLNRTNIKEKDTFGMFASTAVPLRINIKDNMNLRTFVEYISKEILSVLRHQRYPYDVLLKQVREENPSIVNLFDIVLSYQNVKLKKDYEEQYISRWHFNGYQIEALLININERDENDYMIIDYDYLTDVFCAPEIEFIHQHIINLLWHALDNPEKNISKLEMLSEKERYKITYEFNKTSAEYVQDKTISQLFEEQAVKNPHNIAAIYKNDLLTYKELNERSNQLARVLRGKSIRPDEIVGIMVYRSLEMIVGIMGILKAGGAYLPIDPNYPEERIQYIIKDSGIKVLLAQRDIINKLECGINKIDIEDSELYAGDGSNLKNINKSSDLAYIIYTSGSTGKPKGVMIEHQSLINRINWMQKMYPLDENDVILQKTPYTFDVSVWEMFWWSFAGAKVCFLEPNGEKDPDTIIKAIKRYKITTMHFVPSMLSIFMQFVEDNDNAKELSNLKQVFASGEALNAQKVKKFNMLFNENNGTKLHNLYGPTEATIDVTYYNCSVDSTLDVIPIGRPIDNTKIYILDRNYNQQPIGIAGELYIGGVGVARGYLNKPKLTAEKFIQNPFNPEEIIYRTGDLARWFPKGDIEYLGRIDFQVKIRGNRIELGEIESRLLEHNNIIDAVVVVREDHEAGKYLCSYFVSDRELDNDEIKEHLLKILPDYMVPSFFIRMEKLPISANGKVDRKALPEPQGLLCKGTEYVPPSNKTEENLTNIWCGLLGIEKVGINDIFFNIGGDSLKAITLAIEIHRKLDVEIPIGELFRLKTIRNIGEYILKKQKTKYYNIQRVDEKEYYPVSSAQKRIFILNNIDESGISYNIPGFMLVKGEIDRESFENVFQILVKRHESLRTSFDIINNQPVQKIHSDINFKIEYIEAENEEIEEKISNFRRPFDFKKAPLLRVGLIRLAADKHILMFDMHHIISDGASMNILIKEFVALYSHEELPELNIQYKDYSVWYGNYLKSSAIERQKAYWLERFSGELPVLNLPTDFTRPLIQSFSGDKITFEIGAELTGKLKDLSQKSGMTLYMVLLAAYTILLSKYTGQEDISVGTPVACRHFAKLRDIIGLFVNTLVMRNFPNENKTVNQFLQEVKENALCAYENQDYPFEELVENINAKRDLSRNPLFDTMFILQNIDVTKIEANNLFFEPYEFENRTSKFDVLLEAFDREDNIIFKLEYCTKLFSKATIELMIQHFKNILYKITDENKKIFEIDMLTEAEEAKILYKFNNTKAGYRRNKVVHQLFEEQVERTPNSTAVVFNDMSMSYKELNEKSNQLARFLREKGVKPDSVVGIMLHKSMETVISVLGVLKAGGCYLPLDPEYPAERIKYMLDDSQARILITNKELLAKVDFNGIVIDMEDAQPIYSLNKSNLSNMNMLCDLIYVIYTSGSTGKPKGVMLEHKNIVNLVNYEFTKTSINFAHKVLQFASISFDVCYQEIFSTLLSGGELYIAGNESRKNPLSLMEYIAEKGISVVFLPTSYYKFVFSEEKYLNKLTNSIKHIIVAGEQLIVTEQQKKVLDEKGIILHNHYGPSETHVVTTYTINCGEDVSELPPIGKPISNTSILILSDKNTVAPIGIPGELFISGDCVGRGYLNRPELTSEKFIPNPYISMERMYRTGDLAKWKPDGNIEFLGRMDNQVKIRGYRIEIGEIESYLLSFNGIKEVAVIDREANRGKKYLCAYIVSDSEIIISELRAYLLNNLPDYMIPSYYVKLKNLPLTPSGKVDRKALPEPTGSIEDSTEYVAPRNEPERILADIWSTVLKVKEIGVNNNFFELGGDSLAIMEVLILTLQHNMNLTIQDFYKYQTISQLTANLNNNSDLVITEKMNDLGMQNREGIDKIKTGKHDYRNILLTGATGFLGAHLLAELMENTHSSVYCLIRGKNENEVENKLISVLNYYFPKRYNNLLGKRIFVTKGDITIERFGLPDNEYYELANKTNAVIHSAAIVKFYGDYSKFEKTNVFGTQLLIDFCKINNIKLNHISTIGVSGSYLSDQKNKKVEFSENDFYIGQNHGQNVYALSKFNAEKEVFKAVNNGLDATVFRIGFLTGRFEDACFQINSKENAYYNKIKTIIGLGTISEDILEQNIEFTPVDKCSKGIIEILGTKQSSGRVFHMCNPKVVKVRNLIEALKTLNIEIKILSRLDFNQYLNKISKDLNRQKLLLGIIEDLSIAKELNYESSITVCSKITCDYLKKLNFEWPDIDGPYILKVINSLRVEEEYGA